MAAARKVCEFVADNGTDKVVLIIHAANQAKGVNLVLEELARKKMAPRVVCLNSAVPLYLESFRESFNIKLEEDYLTNQDFEDINNFVYKLTTEWYLLKDGRGESVSEYKGIHLGRLVEYDFQSYLVKRIKHLQTVSAVIKKEDPQGIVIISDFAQEFNGLTGLINGLYAKIKILALLKKDKPVSFFAWLANPIKGIFADIATNVIDAGRRKRLLDKGGLDGKILADQRICSDLARHTQIGDNFVPLIFEKGLRLRINLARNKIDYFSFYFPRGIILYRNNRVFRKLKFVERDLNSHPLFDYHSFKIGEMVRVKLKEYFKLSFPYLAKNIDLFQKITKNNSIKAIVLRHDLWELQRLSVELGKKFGFVSLVVQHGVFGDTGEKVVFADKIAVWGKICVDMYKNFGNDQAKCIITGNPRHDRFYNSGSGLESRRKICQELRLEPSKDIVVLLSAPCINILSPYANRDRGEVTLINVIRAMSNFSDKQLIVKLHPYEDGAFAGEALKLLGANKTVIVKHADLYHLLNAADLVITRESSAALKAMILGKPVITLNFEKRGEIIPYASSGAALGVFSQDGLVPAMKRIFSDMSLRERLKENTSKFVADYAYKIDGQASKRVADSIKDAAGLKG